jgi:hypothetical protein
MFVIFYHRSLPYALTFESGRGHDRVRKKFSMYTLIYMFPVIQNCVTGSYSLIYAEFLGAFAEFRKAT